MATSVATARSIFRATRPDTPTFDTHAERLVRSHLGGAVQHGRRPHELGGCHNHSCRTACARQLFDGLRRCIGSRRRDPVLPAPFETVSRPLPREEAFLLRRKLIPRYSRSSCLGFLTLRRARAI